MNDPLDRSRYLRVDPPQDRQQQQHGDQLSLYLLICQDGLDERQQDDNGEQPEERARQHGQSQREESGQDRAARLRLTQVPRPTLRTHLSTAWIRVETRTEADV